jgi:hypothetical protein
VPINKTSPGSARSAESRIAGRCRTPKSAPARLCRNCKRVIAAGAVATLGLDMMANYRAAARYVDRILKGTTPAELPIEQPTNVLTRTMPRVKHCKPFSVP